MANRRPVTPQRRRAVSPAQTPASSASNKPAVRSQPHASNKPPTGPSPRVPNRVSIHFASRPQNVRQHLDTWEAAAQANSTPETLTSRSLIGAIVLLLVAALLVPTLRESVAQSQQLAAQRAQLETSTAKSEELDRELARWEDPNYIASQARNRLNYVWPGDTVWHPIGGDLLTENVDPLTGLRAGEGIAGADSGQPWFTALLQSFLIANGSTEP